MKASVRRFFHGLNSDELTLDEIHSYWDFMKREQVQDFIASLPTPKDHQGWIDREALIKRLTDPNYKMDKNRQNNKAPNPYLNLFKDNSSPGTVIQGKSLI